MKKKDYYTFDNFNKHLGLLKKTREALHGMDYPPPRIPFLSLEDFNEAFDKAVQRIPQDKFEEWRRKTLRQIQDVHSHLLLQPHSFSNPLYQEYLRMLKECRERKTVFKKPQPISIFTSPEAKEFALLMLKEGDPVLIDDKGKAVENVRYYKTWIAAWLYQVTHRKWRGQDIVICIGDIEKARAVKDLLDLPSFSANTVQCRNKLIDHCKDEMRRRFDRVEALIHTRPH